MEITRKSVGLQTGSNCFCGSQSRVKQLVNSEPNGWFVQFGVIWQKMAVAAVYSRWTKSIKIQFTAVGHFGAESNAY